MKRIYIVTGQAGTGKTTWLMQKAIELAPSHIIEEHHTLLAITRMHGARRRIQMKLCESCSDIQSTTSTIDAFALSILNRWRSSLGYSSPIQSVREDANFRESLFGTEASFNRVLEKATLLLQSPTIRNIISESYPLILIDEFQDCHGQLLEFVKILSECSLLIVAADAFQLLDSSVSGCPSLIWLEKEGNQDLTVHTKLTICHRTSQKIVLEAARCLRENKQSNMQTIPVICCPTHGPAAFKILYALIFNHSQWNGSTALICPSHDPFIEKVLFSLDSQIKKRALNPITWFRESSSENEQQQIYTSLGISTNNGSPNENWIAPTTEVSSLDQHVIERVHKYAKLKGIQSIPHKLVARHVDTVVHRKRAYCTHSPKRVITTVHGAKNREFDNVIVLWTYKLPPDKEQQRRLLYNAVTRSRNNCMLLVIGDVNRAKGL